MTIAISLPDFPPRRRVPRPGAVQTATGPLPSGTVTLLMADIEGSTRSWETRPADMATALAALDRTLAEQAAACHGVCPVQQGEGDSFVVAFGRASDAVACALALQQKVVSTIRLRMAVHTGEIQLRDEGNYMGPMINRAARLRDIGHGGQILLSATTANLVGELLPERASLVDLGSHDLRDVPGSERVAQLCHPALRSQFPPLRTRRSTEFAGPPAQLTNFIGRAAELTEARRLLAAYRLLTVAGAGGIGKTRLAAEVARQTRRRREAVCWVGLDEIAAAAQVPELAARALALPNPAGDNGDVPASLVRRIVEHIGERRLLLVIDNCEHLLDAVAEFVGSVLRNCPNVTVLATSREPLTVSGERTWRVPPMALHNDAVRLFTERAHQSDSSFFARGRDLAIVGQICHRLDCVPLAIEHAAARVRAQSLSEVLEGLGDRFHLLSRGSRTAVPRQQSMKACIDWSLALLTARERAVLDRLALLPGGFDVDAARAASNNARVQTHQVLGVLASLVDKSLLTAETQSGRTRFRMSGATRQYLLEWPETADVPRLRCVGS